MHWSEDTVKYIISNQVYMGVLEYEHVSLAGIVPVIVAPELWQRAQAPKKIPNRAQQAPHLLTGLLYCTCCSHNGWTIVKNGRVYYDQEGNFHGRVLRYMCRTKREKNAAACKTRLLDKISLEERVIQIIFSLADDQVLIDEAKKAITEAAATGKSNADEADQMKNELNKVRDLMRELFTDYYDHRMITREQFAQKNSEYLEKETILMERLGQMEARSPGHCIEDAELMVATAAAMRQDWGSMTDAEKKLALRQVIKRIDVYPNKVVVDLFGIKKEIAPKLDSGATLLF